jgi:ribose transport system ATP-binding protein
VLRDGDLIGTVGIEEATPETIAQMMFGEVVKKARPAGLEVKREPVLEVRHLSRKDELYDIDFTLYKGEVLGIAGMLGAGRTELLRAIFGSDTIDSGEIVVGGRTVTRPRPARMKKLGLGLTPESRKEEGLIPLLTVRDNVCLASLGRLASNGVIWKGRQRAVAEKTVQELRIAVSDVEQLVASLSGGNQQKVVVGNWLNTEPLIMLFDEPTRGIDVQAKQQMFQIIWDLSRRGISSILVSSELEELVEVCHRILIMRNGRIVGEVGADGLRVDTLLELSMRD